MSKIPDMEIWKKEKVETKNSYPNLFDQVDQFFESLHGAKGLEYREGQHTMALDIVDALKEQQVLVIEAGVGIGKSYAYLIPLFLAMKENPQFKGFIVATSTISLQEQLLKDIETVKEMLDLDQVDVVLAKGKQNYVCQARLQEFFKDESYKNHWDTVREILKDDLIDHSDIEGLPNSIWQEIHVKNCNIQACPYYAKCKFAMVKESFTSPRKIVITNQDLLAAHLKTDKEESIFGDAELIVVDEAHNFEDKLRTSYTQEVDKRKVEGALYHLYSSVSSYEQFVPPSSFFENLNTFFSKLRNGAKKVLRTNFDEVDRFNEHEKVPVHCSSLMKDSVRKLQKSIDFCIDQVMRKDATIALHPVNKRSLETLKTFRFLLDDILKAEDSENIYWVDFLDPKGIYVRLNYAPRHMDKIASQIFSRTPSAFVLTSATLTSNENDYDYTSRSLGLDSILGKSVLKEYSLPSPYDYSNHTIFYCADDIVNPNENKSLYLEEISERIRTLIEMTKGRTLVLFTAKSDMKYVSERLQKELLDYPIYVQQEGVSNQKLKERFQENRDSCLLATGTFFEGIDIEGESLSSVIIPKLPFPVVDAVTESKFQVYQDSFSEVALPQMMIKLKQGLGRLIRGSEDRGVVSILDSRFLEYDKKYQEKLSSSLPFGRPTTNLDDVTNFVDQKLR